MKIGDKYEATRDLDTPEIAKMIRRDLREQFPGYMFRVRISRGLMRDAIYITVRDVPYDGPARWLELRKFRAVAHAYNYDRSDAQRDRYDVRFHVNAEFEAPLRRREFISAERVS